MKLAGNRSARSHAHGRRQFADNRALQMTDNEVFSPGWPLEVEKNERGGGYRADSPGCTIGDHVGSCPGPVRGRGLGRNQPLRIRTPRPATDTPSPHQSHGSLW
jgi:hypothetical protein